MFGRANFGRDIRIAAGLYLGLCAGLSLEAFAENAEDGILTLLHQGIPHDALYDVCFDGDAGLAVGLAGTVLTTTDAGLTWQPGTPITDKALLGVSCSGQASIAVGQSGTIQIKSDSGDWQTVSSGSDQRLLSVDANEQGLAVAVGGFGAVLRSSDAGATWQPISFDWEAILNDFLEPHIYDVAVFEDNSILIVGEFELVIRSADGGDTWEVVNKADASLSGIYFAEPETGFAVGQDGTVIKTIDGGDTWEVVNKADASLSGIYFPEPETGYAVGQDGTVIKTIDGGLTWQRLETPTNENLLDVWSSGPNVMVTGIRTLLRSSDAGATWEAITEGDVSVKWYQSVKGTPAENGASNNIVMVGHSGRIVQINN